MNTDFSILSQFLDSMGPEVSGHSSTPLSDDEISKIKQFAGGNLSAEEREAILPSILENERALNELVQALGSRK